MAEPYVPEEELPPRSPLSEQSVRIIDGIGPVYYNELKSLSIERLADLAELDPTRAGIPGIPRMRLFEFQRKAKMAVDVNMEVSKFTPLTDMFISEIILKPTRQLCELTDQPEDEVEKLKDKLTTLQVALDNSYLAEVPLGFLEN